MTTDSTDSTRPEAVRLEIDGMHCSSCVAHVEEALTSVEGVSGAAVSLTSRAPLGFGEAA